MYTDTTDTTWTNETISETPFIKNTITSVEIHQLDLAQFI